MSSFRVSGRLAALAFILALAAPPASAAPEPRVTNLHLGEAEGQFLLSFELEGAFTPEIQAEIDSGVPVSFVHEVQGLRGRKWLPDEKKDLRQVVVMARYDALTGQYQLTREVNGLRDRERLTRDISDVAVWMSRVQDVPLGLSRRKAEKFSHLRVRSSLYERRLLAAVPWTLKTAWAQIRLVLP